MSSGASGDATSLELAPRRMPHISHIFKKFPIAKPQSTPSPSLSLFSLLRRPIPSLHLQLPPHLQNASPYQEDDSKPCPAGAPPRRQRRILVVLRLGSQRRRSRRCPRPET